MTQKPKFSERKQFNLLSRIRAAESIQEIAQLLVIGSTCEHASASTLSRWTKAAEKRKKELPC